MPFSGSALAVSALALILAAAPARADTPPWGGAWQSPLRADHPLVGRLLDARTAAPLDTAAFDARVADARFVLFGETHDNADAHAAQAWLLGRMVDAGRRPAVVMEMLDSGQAEALAAYLAAPDATAEGLGPAVAWADSGWPDWTMYQPIAAVALDAGLPILAGNLPTATVRRVGMEGAAAVLGEDALAPRALDAPLPAALRDGLAAEIRTGHCDMLPESALPGMIAAQRARDGEMARALAAAAARDDVDGAVLIAGNGHVRADRAVPWYLERLVLGGNAVTVGILEVSAETPADPTPADLRDTDPSAGPPPFDLVLFTPAVDDLDPCETFREQLERLRERHGGGTGVSESDGS